MVRGFETKAKESCKAQPDEVEWLPMLREYVEKPSARSRAGIATSTPFSLQDRYVRSDHPMHCAGVIGIFVASMCYTEKAPNAWHRRGTQKTGNAQVCVRVNRRHDTGMTTPLAQKHDSAPAKIRIVGSSWFD